MKYITLSSCFNFESGYKTILDTLLKEAFKNYVLKLKAYEIIDPQYEKYFENLPPHQKSLELLLSPPSNGLAQSSIFFHLQPHAKRLIFTMWESTRIYDAFIEILNQQKAIIVPNSWNKNNFIYQGCETPIHVLPLFADDMFTYQEPQNKDKFVFGTANGDPRKRINEVCTCFMKAFPHQKDVELQVKTSSKDSFDKKFSGNKIKTIKSNFTIEGLKDWYANNDAFVSCVSAEGWGFMQHESMACGRSVLAANYAALTEFMTEDNAFCINYKEVPSEGCWKAPAAKWSKYDEEHMIETMRYCYNNRDKVIEKGKKASIDARKLNKQNFLDNLEKILNLYA